jgi:hypothetical protein
MTNDYAGFAEIPPADILEESVEASSVATAIADALTRARTLYLKRLESFSRTDREWLADLKVTL